MCCFVFQLTEQESIRKCIEECEARIEIGKNGEKQQVVVFYVVSMSKGHNSSNTIFWFSCFSGKYTDVTFLIQLYQWFWDVFSLKACRMVLLTECTETSDVHRHSEKVNNNPVPRLRNSYTSHTESLSVERFSACQAWVSSKADLMTWMIWIKKNRGWNCREKITIQACGNSMRKVLCCALTYIPNNDFSWLLFCNLFIVWCNVVTDTLLFLKIF